MDRIEEDLLTLEEALAPLKGLGWVHWEVTRGRQDDYLPEECCYGDDGYPILWLRDGSEALGALHDWIEWHGHRRFLCVETSAGLNLKSDKSVDEPRADIRAVLGAIATEGWHYKGSGLYQLEIDPSTLVMDAWSKEGV